MNYDKETALKVAESLLQIKAIKLNLKEPFQWASGWKSPIYCDNRKTLSHPKIRTYIKQKYVEKIEKNFDHVDVIAGVATGGIAQAALIAQDLGLPLIYVRSSSKGHGLQNQIEGDLHEGQNVVVIEDLISTGMSSLNAVNALREVKSKVLGMVSIFTYDFDVAQKNFEEHQCQLETLSDYHHLIDIALDIGYINESEVESLKAWRENPAEWKP